MCGIFGFFDPNIFKKEKINEYIQKSKKLLSNRGPDYSSQLVLKEKKLVLGHTRLSIIDIADGSQPMSIHEEVSIVFNGEIYNYLELRKDLQKKGYEFKTNSDTEVILKLYQHHGEAFLQHLNGMFAIGLYDWKQNSLLLARDRFGEKPLYYSMVEGGIIFGSEIKSILSYSEHGGDTDYKAFAQFLSLGYIPAPRTQYRKIKKVRPSEYLVYKNKYLHNKKYWSLNQKSINSLNLEEAKDEFEQIFNDSVRLRLRSDVPTGAFLSGGIDSTLINTEIKKIAGNIFTSISVSFDDPAFDESVFSKKVSESIGNNYCQVNYDENDALNDLKKITNYLDEPFADVSILPTYAAARAAKESGLKVMLSGDGADELFGGYSQWYRYATFNKLRKIRNVNQLARKIIKFYGFNRGRGILSFLSKNDSEIMSEKYLNILGFFESDYYHEALDGIEEIENRTSKYLKYDFPQNQMRASLCEFYLPEQIMFKVDRASMANSIESRAPFLDYRLAEFAFTLSNKLLFRYPHGKYLLRKYLPEYISKDIRWKSKQGFTPPISKWFRSSLKDELESALDSKELSDLLNKSLVKDIFHSHMNGNDHTVFLYKLYSWSNAFKYKTN